MHKQLFASKDFNCGEEILTIAAMVSIQVCVSLARFPVILIICRMHLSYLTVLLERLQNWRDESSQQRKGYASFLSAVIHSLIILSGSSDTSKWYWIHSA